MTRKGTVSFIILVAVLVAAGLALFFLMRPKHASPRQESQAASNTSEWKPVSTSENLASTPAVTEKTLPSMETQPEETSENDQNHTPVSVPENAQKIGFFIGSETDMEPEIAEAFQKDGSTVLRDIEIPETPDAVPVYTAVNREIDAFQFMKAVFGDHVEYESQKLAGNQGMLYKTTWQGAEYQVLVHEKYRDSYHRLAVRRLSLPSAKTTGDPEAEARRFAEELLASPFLEDFQIDPEAYYSSLYQTSLVACEQLVDGYPISGKTYYVESDGEVIEAGDMLNIQGTALTVEFDAYGFSGVELTRPLSVTATGETQSIRISAEAALENAINQAKKRYSGHNVIAIRGISLQYLTPVHDGDPLLPVWVISYDYYQNSLRPGSVEFDVGELAFIVDAQTGYVYPIFV